MAAFLGAASLSYFALNLAVDASAESLLLEDDKDLEFFREVSKSYKSNDFLMLAYEPKDNDPFSSESLEILQNLQDDLMQIQGVESILSILNAPLLQSTDNADLAAILKQIPNLTSADINKTKAREEILNSPFYRENIIQKDGKSTALVIDLSPDFYYLNLLNNAPKAEIQAYQEKLKIENKARLEKIKAVINAHAPRTAGLYLGGVSMIADDMINYIKADLAVYGVLLTLLLGAVLWVFFRKISLVLFTLFVCVLSLGAASGIFALLGFKITVISSNYLALMLIITISLIIHLITHFINTCKNFPRASIDKKVLATLLAKSKPSFYAILTTAIGFLSLILSKIEPVIKLGIMMSVGICVSLILSFLFFASVVPNLKNLRFEKGENFKTNFLKFCANFSLKRRKFIYGVSLLCVIISLFGIEKLRVENSFVNYFKDSSEIKKGLVVIDEEFGGTLPLEVLVRFKDGNLGENSAENSALNLSENSAVNSLSNSGENSSENSAVNLALNSSTTSADFDDSFESEFTELGKSETYWFDAAKMRVAKLTHEYLANKEFIGSVLSFNSLLELGKNINGGKELDDFTLAFLNENTPKDFKENLLASYVNLDKNELRFIMRVRDSDPRLKRDEFIKEIKHDLGEILRNENVEIKISGIMLLYNNMLQSLFASQFNTLAFVVLTIFVLFVFVFRSVKYAAFGILANVVPLSLVFAFMGFAGLPLDLMSITIAAICIGIGVDDSIHYIYNFKRELPTAGAAGAIKISHFYIGQAFFQAKIAIILGFCVMMSSNFIPTIYFGFLTVLVMILLLLGSLLLLPSLLAFGVKIRNLKAA